MVGSLIEIVNTGCVKRRFLVGDLTDSVALEVSTGSACRSVTGNQFSVQSRDVLVIGRSVSVPDDHHTFRSVGACKRQRVPPERQHSFQIANLAVIANHTKTLASLAEEALPQLSSLAVPMVNPSARPVLLTRYRQKHAPTVRSWAKTIPLLLRLLLASRSRCDSNRQELGLGNVFQYLRWRREG